MKTSHNLDDDLAAMIEQEMSMSGKPLQAVVNDLLRVGHRARRGKFKVESRLLGLLPGMSYDNVGELLEQLEGPE